MLLECSYAAIAMSIDANEFCGAATHMQLTPELDKKVMLFVLIRGYVSFKNV